MNKTIERRTTCGCGHTGSLASVLNRHRTPLPENEPCRIDQHGIQGRLDMPVAAESIRPSKRRKPQVDDATVMLLRDIFAAR